MLGLNKTVSSLRTDICFRLNLGANFLLMLILRFRQCLVLLFGPSQANLCLRAFRHDKF